MPFSFNAIFWPSAYIAKMQYPELGWLGLLSCFVKIDMALSRAGEVS
jgi:hypothetical protein